MWNKKKGMLRLAAVLMTLFSCSRPASQQSVRRMPAGQEFSGYLSTYANLKANPEFDSTVSYVSQDPVKNIHKYVAVIAITDAVEDAFPIVQTSGPLVLRLRSAIVGVDVGQAVPADQKDEKSLERPINIGKVGVEMEFVDSEQGQQIAAAVDRQSLGEGVMVGSANFSHEEKFRAATQAFDGWAKRLREFLDAAHQLSPDDVARAEKTNFPYAPQPTPK
jgi:hypothetical protein